MYTTDEFVEKVILYGTLPDGRYTSQEIIDVAYDQLLTVVVPLIVSTNEEYYVRSEDQDIESGVASYAIPYRALGMTLREVKLLAGDSVEDLTRIGPEQVKTTTSGTPEAFYLKGLSVILYPTPNATQDSIQLSYFQTPAQPVLVAAAAEITDINRTTGVVTASIPTTWTTADLFDLVSSKNGHDSKALDLTASAVSGTTITFAAADIPTSIVVGDYVALAGQAPYFQCPDLCYRYLIQLTVNEFLQALGAQTELATGVATADRLLQGIMRVMSSRVVGAPKPFTIDPSILR